MQSPITFNDIKTVGPSEDQGGCVYIAKLEGKAFQVIPGADPILAQ